MNRTLVAARRLQHSICYTFLNNKKNNKGRSIPHVFCMLHFQPKLLPIPSHILLRLFCWTFLLSGRKSQLGDCEVGLENPRKCLEVSSLTWQMFCEVALYGITQGGEWWIMQKKRERMNFDRPEIQISIKKTEVKSRFCIT